MENNIPLFENYLMDKLSPEEKLSFDVRLKSDKSFSTDFRIYLMTVKGIYQEANMENIEFGYALKHISKDQLMDIMGREPKRTAWRFNRLRERLAWAASIVVILAAGWVAMFNIKRSGEYKIDNTLVAYNYIETASRDGTESINILDMSDIELRDALPLLKQIYDDSSPEDVQECEINGMQLAMAYLKLHDRNKAKDVLTELVSRFGEDEAFAAQCNLIIRQL